MRIAILADRIPPENNGGAEKVAWTLSYGLCRAGHEVHIITTTDNNTSKEEIDGVVIHRLHAAYSERWRAWLSLYNPQTVPAVRRLLKTIHPDIVHAHNIHYHLSYASLTVAHQLSFPVVFTAHDLMAIAYTKVSYFIKPDRCDVTSPADYVLPRFFNAKQMRLRYNPFRNLLIHRVLRRDVTFRIAVSDAQRQVLEANGLPPFQVVSNGIDPQMMQVSPELIATVQQKLQLENCKVILFAGRINREKGSEQAKAALSRVVERIPDAVLVILARKVKIEDYGTLADHIRTGWLNGAELAAAYALAHVVVAPSITSDPAPTVILEAMAAARPVIATCYGGASELVLDGETGYVINPFDTALFADRLNNLLTDDALARQMGNAGRERLLAHFTLGQQVNATLDIYRAAIATNNAPKH